MLYIQNCILGITIMVLFLSCGSTSGDRSEVSLESGGNAELLSDPDYQKQTAIIIDFYNVNNSPAYQYLSTQIADTIYNKVNRIFVMPHLYYIRQYCQTNEITGSTLVNIDEIKKIGTYFDTDVIIFGQYAVAGNDITIQGKVINIEANTFNDFNKTTDVNSILRSLDDVAIQSYKKSVKTFPPQKKSVDNVVKQATDRTSLISIVDHYLDGQEVSQKSEPKPDNLSENEHPNPRPEWTHTLPFDKEYVYYIGQTMGSKSYSEALQMAIHDALWQMSFSLGARVGSSYSEAQFEGEKKAFREISSNVLVETLNFVHGEEMVSKYYRHLSDSTYEVCVLFRLSRTQLEKSMQDSLQMEAVRLDNDAKIASAKQSEAEAQKIKTQMELLDKMNKKTEEKPVIEEPKPKFSYQPPDPTVAVKSIPPETVIISKKAADEQLATVEKPSETKPQFTHPYRAAGWMFNVLGIGMIGTGNAFLFRSKGLYTDADSLYSDYQTAVSDSTIVNTVLETMYQEVQDKREDALLSRNVGILFTGVGVTSFTFGCVFLAIKKPVKDSNVAWQVFPMHQGMGSTITIRF